MKYRLLHLQKTYLHLKEMSLHSFSAIRSEGGIDSDWEKQQIDDNGAIMIKPVIFIRKKNWATLLMMPVLAVTFLII